MYNREVIDKTWELEGSYDFNLTPKNMEKGGLGIVILEKARWVSEDLLEL